MSLTQHSHNFISISSKYFLLGTSVSTSQTKNKMQSGFLLDVVVRKSSPIFQLFSSKDETLLVWWDSFLVLNFCFDIFDVVVGKSSSIFQLLSSEDETLLIWWDSFLVLDFSLNIFDGIRCFNFERNGFSCQSFDKDLHSSSQTKDQVKSGFLLDVVVGKCSSIFQLLSSEDETLLIGWNTFLVLDFGFNIFDGIR